jgi:hypothetical protein
LLVHVADGAAGIECGGDTDVQLINERLEKSRNDSCHKNHTLSSETRIGGAKKPHKG